jgi:hypothetical protein
MAGIGRLLFEAGYQNSSNKILSRLTHIMILFYLLEFKPEVYDLLLIDINVPKINSFKFSVKILKLDINTEFASCH